MTKSTTIILDRLADALAQQGIQLKRQQLLQVASSAFGYRNDNAFASAASKGEFAAPMAQAEGRDERGLTVIHDPVANREFAVDLADKASRAGKWMVSPYGNLLDVSAVPLINPDHTAPIKIYAANISHRHGTNFYVALTKDKLESQIASYCDDWWDEIREENSTLPETTEGMPNSEVVSTYFEVHDSEFLERSTEELPLPHALARRLVASDAETWVIVRQEENSDDAFLWWNDEDGWGGLESASVYPEPAGCLPVVGMADYVVKWQKLPRLVVTTPIEKT